MNSGYFLCYFSILRAILINIFPINIATNLKKIIIAITNLFFCGILQKKNQFSFFN